MGLKFKDFKLSEFDQNYLLSIAVPRYILKDSGTPVQVWFEVFIDYCNKIGYKVIKASELRDIDTMPSNDEQLLQHTLEAISFSKRDNRTVLITSKFNKYTVYELLKLGYTLSIDGNRLSIEWI
jgi:hypothetical protein